MSKLLFIMLFLSVLSAGTYAQTAGNSTTSSNMISGGIDESSVEKGVKIYPNPSPSGIFTVEFENADKMKVVNVLGVTVLEEKIGVADSKKTVDLSRYSNGVYFISLANGSKKVEYRVVINR